MTTTLFLTNKLRLPARQLSSAQMLRKARWRGETLSCEWYVQCSPEQRVLDRAKADVVEAAIEGEGGEDEAGVGEHGGKTCQVKKILEYGD